MYGIDIIALNWGVAIVVFFLIVWIIMAKKLLKSEPTVIKTNMADRYNEIKLDEIKKYGINLNEFKNMAGSKFIDIHNALTNYDYEVLKKNLTNDLYQYYTEQLEVMEKIKHRNIMKDFEIINIKIYNVSNEHNLLSVDFYLNVRMFDYVIDIDTKECIRGNINDKIDFEFELRFEKRNNGNDINNQFVMSKKSCINDMEIKKR